MRHRNTALEICIAAVYPCTFNIFYKLLNLDYIGKLKTCSFNYTTQSGVLTTWIPGAVENIVGNVENADNKEMVEFINL